MSSTDLWRTAPARAIQLAAEEVHRSPYFTADGKALITVRLVDVLRNWQDSRLIRCPEDSAPLSKDELKALGLRGSLKMDQAYLEALSPEGRAHPDHAAEVVCHRARNTITFEGNVRGWQAMDVSKCVLRSAGNGRECHYAKRMDRKQLRVADLATWPPPECDAEWCSCVLLPKLF